MAEYNPSNASASPTEAQGGEGEDRTEESKCCSALVPKSILGGKEFNVGDEVVLKVMHIYSDEVELAYAPEKKGSKSNMDEAMEGMDRYSTQRE